MPAAASLSRAGRTKGFVIFLLASARHILVEEGVRSLQLRSHPRHSHISSPLNRDKLHHRFRHQLPQLLGRAGGPPAAAAAAIPSPRLSSESLRILA